MIIKTRFSPSPTGLLHLGNVRAALCSALYAKKNRGVFLLRIEDTDVARSEERFIDFLQEDLRWLGLDWQEGPIVDGANGPYYQSHRQKIYDRYYDELEKSARAYPCFCSEHELTLMRKIQSSRGQAPRYAGTCRHLSKEEIGKRLAQGLKPALRFLVPPSAFIEFVDLVKGAQRFNSDDIGDYIIRRMDGTPSFMFCNAIDDSLMGVTHAIRGEDHLTNTPRQLMILQALNLRLPQYGHVSLITGDDGSPLSKRHGSFSLRDLREQGFLSLAVLNYLARLGHGYEENHIFPFEGLADHFRIDSLSRSPAHFDKNQLLHWQKETVTSLSLEAIWDWLGKMIQEKVPENKRHLFADLMRKNILFPAQAMEWADRLFCDTLSFSEAEKNNLKQVEKGFFDALYHAIEKHGEDFKTILQEMKTAFHLSGKALFIPVRIALTGVEQGPELAHLVSLLGKEKMLERVQHVRNLQ